MSETYTCIIRWVPRDLADLIFLYFAGNPVKKITYNNIIKNEIVELYDLVESYNNTIISYALKYACQCGNLEGAKYFYKFRSYTQAEINECLRYACKYGDINIIKFIEDCGGVDWNKGLQGACEGNKLDVVKHMLAKGASKKFKFDYDDPDVYNRQIRLSPWDFAWEAACTGDDLRIVKELISHGENNIKFGAAKACSGHNIEIAKFFLEHKEVDLNWCFEDACGGYGNMEIIKQLLKMGAMITNLGIRNACEIGNSDIVDYLIETKKVNNLNMYIASAGTWQILKLLVKHGASDYNCILRHACRLDMLCMAEHAVQNGADNYDEGLKYSCEFESIDTMKYMIKCGANPNVGLRSACLEGDLYIAKYMVRCDANNLNEGLIIAYKYMHYKTAKFMIKCGANHCGSCLKIKH